jgi:hypothetical protein
LNDRCSSRAPLLQWKCRLGCTTERSEQDLTPELRKLLSSDNDGHSFVLDIVATVEYPIDVKSIVKSATQDDSSDFCVEGGGGINGEIVGERIHSSEELSRHN